MIQTEFISKQIGVWFGLLLRPAAMVMSAKSPKDKGSRRYLLRRLQEALLVVMCVSWVVSAPLSAEEISDPYESVNRKIFAFNEFGDKWFLSPVARGYRWITPDFVDIAITNIFQNLAEIRNLLNGALQGDLKQTGTATTRFIINSTVGLVGIFDPAAGYGFEHRNEDFGQTLAVWGFKDSPYIVLPFWGGRTLRDTFGMIPDYYSSPTTYLDDVAIKNSSYSLFQIDKRADLINIEALIFGDKYVFLRDVYLQTRAANITNGHQEEDFDDDF